MNSRRTATRKIRREDARPRARPGFLACWLVLACAANGTSAGDLDVVIDEIHYNPLSGDADDEFLELHNAGTSPVDIGGWSFTEGISFTFAPGTIIAPHGFLVVCRDAARISQRYGMVPLAGNYGGKLDNDGEIVTLRNAAGEVVSRVCYRPEGPWPSRPDGLGPSLELLDSTAPADVPSNWSYSTLVGGTPGRANSRSSSGGTPRVLLGAADPWRVFEGLEEPGAWTAPGFDDSGWREGPASLCYGAFVAAEEKLPSMRGRYTSVYLRGRFVLDSAGAGLVQGAERNLQLRVRYSDAFVAYLDGVEVGRDNVGAPGSPVSFDVVATRGHYGEVFLRLDDRLGAGAAGEHVVAVQGVNDAADSPDFVIEAEVSLVPAAEPVEEIPPALVLNEIAPGAPGVPGFIEILNRGSRDVRLEGHAVVDGSGRRFDLPAATIPAGALWTVSEEALGGPLTLGNLTYVLVRGDATSGGDRFVDALEVRPARPGAGPQSVGRFPDGAEEEVLTTSPTPGAPNEAELPDAVVIHEIHYHPSFVPPSEGCERQCSDALQWIELHNRGAASADLQGWSLTKAVSFDFPPGTSIPPGGHLVVAASRERFLAAHPGIDPSQVVGDWTRALARDAETIRLRDAFGNTADSVRYGDGKPANDAEPADGADDATFRGSAWPREADGTGRTLELVHPALDNSLGGSWAAGPVGGTPGAPNASFLASPPPVVGEVVHAPAVPGPEEAVTVRCRVSAVGAIAGVAALWRVEGSPHGGVAELRDDGRSEDWRAGDGVWTGAIPPIPEGSVVAFSIRARLADGRETTVPEPPRVPPYPGFDGPYYLYQVLSAAPPPNRAENYHVILSEADRRELFGRPVTSDVLLPCTFVRVGRDGVEEVRHLAGIRFRGSQSREDPRKSYRIEFPPEARFQGIEHLNLNASNPDRELIALDLIRCAGLPYPQSWPVNLTFQGDLDIRYLRKEAIDGDFVERFFGGASDSGNLYRAMRPENDLRSGNLSYYGPDPEEYRPYYSKRTNEEEDDYSDIVELCRVFDPVETTDEEFADALEGLADVEEWARFFAVHTVLANQDGGMHTRAGEDYFLYRVPTTSPRPDAGKWVLVPWDVEESFVKSTEPLFASEVQAVRRFLRHPRFAPLYYDALTVLRDGVFSRREMKARFSLVSPIASPWTIDLYDTFVAERLGFLDANVPVALIAGAAASPPEQRLLVQVGDDWSYWKGTAAPPGGELAWTAKEYAATGWLAGRTGIGYGYPGQETVLDDMRGRYTSVYARKVFDLEDPRALPSLEILIDYDAGFVAYLNGAEVARRNVPGLPGAPVPHDAVAMAPHRIGTPEAIGIPSFARLLEAGTNVLAIQFLSEGPGAEGASILPQLGTAGAGTGGAGCGSTVYAGGPLVRLSGRAAAGSTRSVRLEGRLVDYDPYRATWYAAVSVPPGETFLDLKAYATLDGSGPPVESLPLRVVRFPRPPVPVRGTLSGRTVWSPEEGPFLLGGDVLVEPGASLEIQPGTIVLGGGGASLVVRGELRAAGTESSPIRILPLGCGERWGGIALAGTGTDGASPTHVLRHCLIEGGSRASGLNGCVAAVEAKLLVEGCHFRSIEGNAVDGVRARIEVRDGLFDEVFEGVHGEDSTVAVVGCTFRRSIGNQDAIDLDSDGASRSIIQGCVFEDGTDDGIDLQATSCDIRDNAFRNIADKALSLEMEGSLGAPTVTGNLIVACGTGIAVKSGIRLVEAHHNTIVGCDEGVELYEKMESFGGAFGRFHSMIVWDNGVDVRTDARSAAVFSYSDTSGAVEGGPANISADPLFADALAGDFSLAPGSPCIGSGLGGTDMGAIPFGTGDRAFVRGDPNLTRTVDISDGIFVLSYLYLGGSAPTCLRSADVDGNGALEITDGVYLLSFLFLGGPEPPGPFPECGRSLREGELPCAAFPPCE